MEVTRQNLEDTIPQMLSHLESASFIALDCEFTGIFESSTENFKSILDSPEERYRKMVMEISKFTICQLGIALFERYHSENAFKVNAYKIYTYPVAFDTFAKRENLIMQVSAVNFLASSGFDFNKFLVDGAPYLNLEKRRALESFLKSNPDFMESCENLDQSYFPDRHDLASDEDVEEIVNRLSGVSKIMKCISASNKPIIGHNMLTDLILIHHHFFYSLPASYQEFKNSLHSIFHTIYDTKRTAQYLKSMITSENPSYKEALWDTNLFKLFATTNVLGAPKIILEGQTNEYKDDLAMGVRRPLNLLENSKCHEASFDAVITGCVFVKLAFLAFKNNSSSSSAWNAAPRTLKELIFQVQGCINQIHLPRAQLHYICLDGNDHTKSRPQMIHVTSKNHEVLHVKSLLKDLAKHGDMEIVSINRSEVLIQCASNIILDRTKAELKQRGFSVKVGATGSFFERLRLNKIADGKRPLLAVAGFTLLAWVARTLWKLSR